MRIIVTSLGSGGDVYPLIAVGETLRRRGHDVLGLFNDQYRERVETLGFSFRSLGTVEEARRLAQAPFMRRPRAGLARLWREAVLPNAERLGAALEDECRGGGIDWIVYLPAAVGAPWAARRYGARCAAATLSPRIWLEYNAGEVHAAASPYETTRERLRRRALRATRSIVRYFTDRDLNRIRKRLGYEPMRDVFARQFRDCDLNLGLWSSALRRALDSDPVNGRICGFTRYEGGDDAGADGELRRFLEDGEAPIVFTLGTTVKFAAGNFYETAARACRMLGRRGVLLTGAGGKRPRGLPKGVRAWDYARYSEAFGGAAAAVHHGGIGTTGQALRAGAPSVITPVAWDQFDNAEWAARLGTSVSLSREQANARRLARALGRVMREDVRRRAGRIAEKLRGEDGAESAADLIEGIS